MSSLLPVFASVTHTCNYSSCTKHGYERVMIHPTLKLCEVGEGCYAKCPYSFKPTDVKPCPTCGGKPDVDTPPYSCSTCDVFGIVRVSDVAYA